MLAQTRHGLKHVRKLADFQDWRCVHAKVEENSKFMNVIILMLVARMTYELKKFNCSNKRILV